MSCFFVHSNDRKHKISPYKARSKNYRSIAWTKPEIDELYTMYTQEPLSMSCNRSDGIHFPGFKWEGAPITEADIQVPMHRIEICPEYNPHGVVPLEQGECGYLGECIY